MRTVSLRDIEEADLPAVLAVQLSDPEYLSWTEGSAGEAGHYDLGMLQRDWTIAGLMGRRMLGIFADGRMTGFVDLLEEHPQELVPWIGLIMVHADQRRLGYGRDAASQVFDELRTRGATLVRAGTMERNAGGRGFAEVLGMYEIDRRTTKLAAGDETLVVFEKPL